MSKRELAQAFEEQAEAIVEARPKRVLKSTGGKARTLKVVNAEGEVIGLATHAEVLSGAAKVAEVELAVQDGKRPAVVLCSKCGMQVLEVKHFAIPKYCPECKREVAREANRQWFKKRGREAHAPPRTPEQSAARRARRSAMSQEEREKHLEKQRLQDANPRRKELRRKRLATPEGREKQLASQRRSYRKKAEREAAQKNGGSK